MQLVASLGARKLARTLLSRRLKRHIRLFTNAGTPTDDTDLASADGDLVIDTTNNRVYVAANVTSTTTTWRRLDA